MLRLGRLADYAIVLCASLAEQQDASTTARSLARETGIPPPTVIKLLKLLTAAGLTRSTQGRHGGYALARPPAGIGLTEIIETVQGPIALTECSREVGLCGIQGSCQTQRHWLAINRAFREALAGIRLADLAGREPFPGGPGNGAARGLRLDAYRVEKEADGEPCS